jgi:hypothetical protein
MLALLIAPITRLLAISKGRVDHLVMEATRRFQIPFRAQLRKPFLNRTSALSQLAEMFQCSFWLTSQLMHLE